MPTLIIALVPLLSKRGTPQGSPTPDEKGRPRAAFFIWCGAALRRPPLGKQRNQGNDQGWHRWRHWLYGSRIAALARAASGRADHRDHVAQGSRNAGGGDVSQPARPRASEL